MDGFWFKIEIVIIIVVITIQLYRSFEVYSNIKVFRDIFSQLIEIRSGFIERKYLNNTESVLKNILYISEDDKTDISDNTTVKISLAQTKSTNEIIIVITDAINNYLVNNYGAVVNFSIIKDIIDREVDAKDEEISLSIPTPLYLGLAATMVGIICGLFAMPQIGGTNFSSAINSLITGVKFAMAASLIGLACTTYLSSILYKQAKRKTLKEKNQQISYLLAKLLPELIKAEDTGVSGLKASLDRFAREATKIADNINNAALYTSKNIQAEQDLLSRIEKLNMLKVSRYNLELFDRFESTLSTIDKFTEYLSQIAVVAYNLKEFSIKTKNFDQIGEQILSTLQDSKQLTQFLTTHLEKIETIGLNSLSAVSLTDANFRKAIDILDSNLKESLNNLNLEINERISSMNKLSDDAESMLNNSFEELVTKLNYTTSQHIDEFKTAYSDAVPQFKQLDELRFMETIYKKLDNLSDIYLNSISTLIQHIDRIADYTNKNNENSLKLESSTIKDNYNKKSKTDKNITPDSPKTIELLSNPEITEDTKMDNSRVSHSILYEKTTFFNTMKIWWYDLTNLRKRGR